MMHSDGLVNGIAKGRCLNPCFNGWCTLTNWSNVQEFTPYLVLILVLMDDALWRLVNGIAKGRLTVLILVLMDDALWRTAKYTWGSVQDSLNPCFNGWCTLTPEINCFDIPVNEVLILVLMDDALWLSKNIMQVDPKSLNPCFNGWCTLTL